LSEPASRRAVRARAVLAGAVGATGG